MNNNKKVVSSFEQGCKIMGYRKDSGPITKNMPSHFGASSIAHYRLMVIFEAQNKLDEFEVDYRPGNDQWKYCPWAEIKADEKRKSGFGFSNTDCAFVSTVTGVGSRLCVGSSERAKQIFNKHKKLYADFWFLPADHLKTVRVKKMK